MRKQAVRYAIASVLSLAIVFSVVSVLVDAFHCDGALAYGCALCIASCVNFVTCRWYVFEKHEGSVAADFVRFVASIAGWRLVELCAFIVLHELAGIHYAVVVLLVNGSSAVGKFFWARLVVFGRPELASDLWQPQPLAANDEP